MSGLEVHQFIYFDDNYGVLVHSPETGETASIDVGDADAVLAALKEKGWRLSHLLVTHHHGDHVQGLAQVKAATGCKVIGPAPGSRPVAGLDETVGDGDIIAFGGGKIRAIHTPGHTLDMINYHFPDENTVFTGDTLFALGCGRVFEGDMAMMWNSLGKLAALPPETKVYCGHEYTEANAGFALTVDPANKRLAKRAEEIRKLRKQGRPTIPTTIALELETNPFLRPSDPAIRAHLGMEDAEDWEVFGEIRTRKDRA